MEVTEKKRGRGGGIPVPGLRHHRQRRGLTGRELAEKAGITATTVVELEGGRRGAQPGTLRKLAKALGVGTEDLVEEG